MESLNPNSSKQFLGLPLILIWGYIAVAIFMTGDGIEQAFYLNTLLILVLKPIKLLLY